MRSEVLDFEYLSVGSETLAIAQKTLARFPEKVNKVLARAMKRMGKRTETQTVKQTAKLYYLKPSFIRPRISVQTLNDSIRIYATTNRLTAASYYMSPKSRPKKWKGLHIGVKRGMGIGYVSRGFFITTKYGTKVAFERFEPGRWSGIESISAPSVYYDVKDAADYIADDEGETFTRILRSEILRELGVIVKK